MNKKQMRKLLVSLKMNTSALSAGLILCMILSIISPISLHPVRQLLIFGISGLVLIFWGAKGILSDSIRKRKPDTLDEDAQNYVIMEHRRHQRKFIIYFVVWMAFTMVLVWSLVLLRRLNPDRPFRMLVAYEGFWLIALLLFPALREFLYLFFSRRLAGYGSSPRRLKSVAQFIGVSFVYWSLLLLIVHFVTDRGLRWDIRVYGLILYTGVFLLIVYLSKENWGLLPYISMISAIKHRRNKICYDESSGIYTIQMASDEPFRILQLTDIHLGGSLISSSKDQNALEAVYDLILETRPDFIVVTGDLVFPLGIQSFSINNYAPMVQFASFMRNIGIPWAFTFGNHDTEFMASHSASEIKRLFEQFSYKNTYNLLYDEGPEQISGRSNQMIRLLNCDGSINQLLFLLDSNAYIGKSFRNYDFIHDDQVKWYEQMLLQEEHAAGHTISSLLFFHMPLQEFREAYEHYKKRDPSVTYYYGKVGEKNEEICCSTYKSKLFSMAVELGSTKGMFIGHDHYNNISMEYKGIRLTYGLSIDYLAMPGISKHLEQRGATLITVSRDSSFAVQPIYLKDID